jgi:hypothetical protein
MVFDAVCLSLGFWKMVSRGFCGVSKAVGAGWEMVAVPKVFGVAWRSGLGAPYGLLPGTAPYGY